MRGNPDVDDVERARRRAASVVDERPREEGLFGTRTGHDHVGRSDRLAETFEAEGDAVDPFCERRSAIGGAIGHEDVGATGAVQCDGNTLAHRTGADDEDPLAVQFADHVGDHLDCGMADRCGATGDTRLAAGALPGGERRAEQLIQRRPGRTLSLRRLPRCSYLAEDLTLAEHGRVETGGNLEQMRDRRGVVLAVEMRRQFVDGQVTELAQEVADVTVGAVEEFGHDVDLGPVARRQHHGLTHVVALSQTGHGLAELFGRDRDALEQRQ